MVMKLLRIPIFVIFFVLLSSIVNAEDKKLKFRGINKTEEFKNIQINISPDLLKFDEFENLKTKYEIAKNFAIETDKSLKKKVKFRSVEAEGITSKKEKKSPGHIYNDFARSVFFLLNAKEKGVIGTGFLVDDSGLILSNWHVTEGTKDMLIWVLPKQGVVDAKILFKNIDPYFGLVVAENKKEDLALIKVNGLPKDIKAIEMGSNQEVKVGDNVYAIGHPKSLPWSFTAGMVSQIRPNHEWTYPDGSEHEATVIQMQTPISTGNSGGPLFSGKGSVVGVNTLFELEGQNLNFAIAVDHVKQFIKDNPNYEKVNPIGARIKKDYPNAIEQDYNNNGMIDTWYVDDDKNGKIDTAFIDDDENGYVEGTLIDKNENGVWEIEIYDTDQDGKKDLAYLDEDEDKKRDVKAYDYDQDGNWDKFEKLS